MLYVVAKIKSIAGKARSYDATGRLKSRCALAEVAAAMISASTPRSSAMVWQMKASLAGARYREARDLAQRARAMVDLAFGDRDVLLVPAVSGEAPVGLNSTGNAAFCSIWTTLHVPAMTLPLFKGPNGLPVGAQFVARRNADRRLMAACRWVMRQASGL